MTQETQLKIGSVVWTALMAAVMFVDAPRDAVGAIIFGSISIVAGFGFYFAMRWAMRLIFPSQSLKA